MTKPLISIIVPCYNHAEHLEERFNSIFSQDVTDCEFIVLDDASQDGSTHLLKQILANRPHVFLSNDINSGSPFKQWERGLQVASGKYIWIAESDDSCAPDFLSSLLGPLERDGLSLAFTKVQTIDESSNPLDTPYWPELLDREFFRTSQTTSCRFFLQKFMGARNCIPNASAVVFRAEHVRTKVLDIVKSVNSYKYAGDWVFWAKLLEKYGNDGMFFCASPLCFHRMHAGATRAVLTKEREKVRILEYSSAINCINAIHSISSLSRLAKLLFSESWNWSYEQYISRFRPGFVERLLGRPQHGLHRLGYLFYRLRRFVS